MPMVITEEFSFPIITGNNRNNVVHLTVLPPLWTRCSTSDHQHIIRRNKLFTRSFSHVEAQLLLLKPQSPNAEIAQEKMDMLWEDFNTHESLPVPVPVPVPHNDHHHHLQSPPISAFSSSSSSPIQLETLNRLSPPSSSNPRPISITNTNRGEEKESAGAGPECGSFKGKLEIQSSSNLMIVAKEKKKKSKKKKVVQESIVRMMKKFFLLKNITAFKFHKNK